MTGPREGLDWDIGETITVQMGTPTANGYDQVVLRPDRIDDHAQALYGYHSCHYLASAISCMTGDWPLVTLTGIPPGHDARRHVHSAVVAPDGRVLDIFGVSASVEAWRARWTDRAGFPLQLHEQLRSEDMPRVTTNSEDTDLPSGRLWWTHGDDRLTALHQHFARAVLRQHGYARHLLPEARTTDARSAGATQSSPGPSPGARRLIHHAAALARDLLIDAANARWQLVTVAVGCVGGRHRSVALAEEITAALRADGIGAVVEHRDITKPVIQK